MSAAAAASPKAQKKATDAASDSASALSECDSALRDLARVEARVQSSGGELVQRASQLRGNMNIAARRLRRVLETLPPDDTQVGPLGEQYQRACALRTMADDALGVVFRLDARLGTSGTAERQKPRGGSRKGRTAA